jgi:hypothetical protein
MPLRTLDRGGGQTRPIAARNTMTWIIMLPLLAVAFLCAAIPTLYDSGPNR